MNPEERLSRLENSIEKQNEAIRSLIAVGRTCLRSIQELRESRHEDHVRRSGQIDKLRETQSATDEQFNILMDTVDRIIRGENPGQRRK